MSLLNHTVTPGTRSSKYLSMRQVAKVAGIHRFVPASDGKDSETKLLHVLFHVVNRPLDKSIHLAFQLVDIPLISRQ